MTECVKCDKSMPADATSNGWVECSCSAHTGWYCDSCSPGNDCYDDEECDCCNPLEDEEDKQLREKIGAWLSDKTNHEGDLVDFLVDDCGVVVEEEE